MSEHRPFWTNPEDLLIEDDPRPAASAVADPEPLACGHCGYMGTDETGYPMFDGRGIGAQGGPSLDVAAFLDSLRSPRNSLGKLALPKGQMEWAVQEAWESAQEWVGDPDDGIVATHLDVLADSIIDRLAARLGEPAPRPEPEK